MVEMLEKPYFQNENAWFKKLFLEKNARGWGEGGYGVRQISLIDTDLSVIPELSREIHQVQGTRETPVSCSLGSLPGSVVDGIKQTNKVMTDCARRCKKYTRVMREITSSLAG